MEEKKAGRRSEVKIPPRYTEEEKNVVLNPTARQQKLRREAGSIFESEFRETCQFFNCWAYKFVTGFGGTPFDYIFVGDRGTFALELKQLIKNSMRYDMLKKEQIASHTINHVGYSSIRANQRIGLEQFQNDTLHYGTSYLVVKIIDAVACWAYLVPWDEIRSDVLSGVRGTFDVRKYHRFDRLRLQYVDKNGDKKDAFIWDIDKLATIREEYKQAYDDAKDRLADIYNGGAGFTKAEREAIKTAFDAAQSSVFNQIKAEFASMGLPEPNISIRTEEPTGRKKHHYPSERRPSNGAVRNAKTWGKGRDPGLPNGFRKPKV